MSPRKPLPTPNRDPIERLFVANRGEIARRIVRTARERGLPTVAVYGLGAQAMAGGGFSVPFDTVAWPTGEIGGMGLEGAVNLGFKKRLEACATEAERAALFEKLVGVMYDKGRALNAAAALEFDAVIDPAETRARILRGLDAFGPISRGHRSFVDTW